MVTAYGNNSRKRTALLTDTFFNSRGCPLTRELTVPQTTSGWGVGIAVFNRPFPGCLLPLFQNESNCETFHMKMSKICI